VQHSKIGCRLSGWGQTLPTRDFCGTAALALKPDIGWRGWHVRKVPTSRLMHRSKKDVQGVGLFDHLVGGDKELVRHGEAERSSSLEVDQ
jgi:hypothetical protein